jgi:hypothetical protein
MNPHPNANPQKPSFARVVYALFQVHISLKTMYLLSIPVLPGCGNTPTPPPFSSQPYENKEVREGKIQNGIDSK